MVMMTDLSLPEYFLPPIHPEKIVNAYHELLSSARASFAAALWWTAKTFFFLTDKNEVKFFCTIVSIISKFPLISC